MPKGGQGQGQGRGPKDNDVHVDLGAITVNVHLDGGGASGEILQRIEAAVAALAAKIDALIADPAQLEMFAQGLATQVAKLKASAAALTAAGQANQP